MVSRDTDFADHPDYADNAFAGKGKRSFREIFHFSVIRIRRLERQDEPARRRYSQKEFSGCGNFRPPCRQILEKKRQVQQEANGDSDRFKAEDVPRPGAEYVDQAGRFRFMRDEQVVAADQLVEDKNHRHVDVHPDRHLEERFRGRSEFLDGRHVDRAEDDQPVGGHRLEEAEVRKAVDPRVRGEQRLHRRPDPHEKAEFVDRIIPRNEHVRAGKHHDRTDVQGKMGLDRPQPAVHVPGVKGELV